MKFKFLSIFTIILLLISPLANAEKIDRIVAVVNDDIITLLELDLELTKLKRSMQQQNAHLPGDEVLRKQVLERMVLLQIQLQRAEKRRIRIGDESLNRALNKIAEQNSLTLQQLRETLEGEGGDYQDFRKTIREQMIVSRLQQREVDNTITVTEQEIETFLAGKSLRGESNTEYKLQHILISVPESATSKQIQTSKKEAQDILKKIAQGEDFFQMAVSHSDGQQALLGGDLGWRKYEAIPSLFVDQIIAMETGKVSSIIRSPSGFHLIRLADKRSNEKTRILRQTKARHILIKTDSETNEKAAFAKAEKLKLRLAGGEDFAMLAKANSDDKGSGAAGGDLGWISPGQMVAQFEKAVNVLEVGHISDPVRTQFGWHLIEVLEHRDLDNTDAYIKNNSRHLLRTRKLEPALDNWRRRLRDEAFVRLKL